MMPSNAPMHNPSDVKGNQQNTIFHHMSTVFQLIGQMMFKLLRSSLQS
jgi:hypothetical protein